MYIYNSIMKLSAYSFAWEWIDFDKTWDLVVTNWIKSLWQPDNIFCENKRLQLYNLYQIPKIFIFIQRALYIYYRFNVNNSRRFINSLRPSEHIYDNKVDHHWYKSWPELRLHFSETTWAVRRWGKNPSTSGLGIFAPIRNFVVSWLRNTDRPCRFVFIPHFICVIICISLKPGRSRKEQKNTFISEIESAAELHLSLWWRHNILIFFVTS